MLSRNKILTGLAGIILLGIIYFFVLPPRVVKTAFLGKESALDSVLTINFDKPVKRQELEHNIFPAVLGEWSFRDPIIENHLFRTLVFTPALGFEPETEYKIVLENAVNPFGIGLSKDFSFAFTTGDSAGNRIEKSSSEIVKAQSKSSSTNAVILDIPLDWQDSALSCEAASLKMALSYKGIDLTENEIMAEIGYDYTPRYKNLWGDPYQSFVGDINGKICKTGFGVFWPAVARAADKWAEAVEFSNGSLLMLTREIESGNPVVVWGVLPVKNITDCSWQTADNKQITAFQETHVRLAIGFLGDVENPSTIVINDPLSGQLFWSAGYFLTNWRYFGYSGVVIR